MNVTEVYKVYEYKARVKSIYILNKYLSNYDNQDEEFELSVTLQNGKISEDDSYNIYMNLGGYNSQKVTGYFDEEAVAKRTKQYIDEATKKGIIDSKDVLSIKGLN